ncbi:ABC transporter substrate-binding protein [Altererythrobacter sp. KTW20L]|uniref:ABC transporter substrate-binding protein n=1 Tax=Altererythrobacter sp. KTW20L TaxID=2942210 RepID=UPI0020C0164A|nr:ABC transporter substrate-binding protein [Altererythrobacter sp. KTW20L]MCL6251566.1 ABC transporter substrate-binding protein [Altererythrobacter sp. KTW20L]
MFVLATAGGLAYDRNALAKSSAGDGIPAAEPAIPSLTPRRIVSLNVCTDQMLMQMVERDRIRAISYLATNPRYSAMVEQARSLPMTEGLAEEVIAMRPDLVLAGTFSARETVALLQRLGYNVVEFEPEGDFPSIIANLRKMAQAVGEPERGEAMVRQIEQALAAVPQYGDYPAGQPVYANYDANGFTSGDGALVAAVANAAGFETLGQRLGLGGTRQVSLEQMLVSRPDVIDLASDYPAPALATEMFRHPVLQKLVREQRTIAIPARYTGCGNMLTLRALEAFVAARQEFD